MSGIIGSSPNMKSGVFGQAPKGSVVQANYSHYASGFGMANDSWTSISGLNMNLTPRSVQNWMMVTFNLNSIYLNYHQGDYGNGTKFRIIRVIGGSAATPTGMNTQFTAEMGRASKVGEHMSITAVAMDIPNTTSEVTYTIQYENITSGQSSYLNDTASTSINLYSVSVKGA